MYRTIDSRVKHRTRMKQQERRSFYRRRTKQRTRIKEALIRHFHNKREEMYHAIDTR